MKQRSMKKRLLSLALTLAMLLSYIPGAVWAVDADTDIKAIERPTGWVIVEDYDDYFGDGWENKLELPSKVDVTLADGSTVQAPVTWDTSVLDTRTPGYYYLPGDVTLPAGTTNGQNLTVSITIQVREYVNLFNNGNFEQFTGSSALSPRGWYLSGTGNKAFAGLGRNGSYAISFFSDKVTSTYHTSYNTGDADSPANVGARVAAQGAGQYYVGIYGKKGDGNAVFTLSTTFLYRTGTQTSTPSNQKISGNTVTLTGDYQASEMIVSLPENVSYAQLQFVGRKVDTTIAFNDIGIYFDDAQLIPLKTALKTEPSAISEVKTEILSRFVALNYDKYVGENWIESLGLPETVEVLTDKGDIGSVGVTWNYSALDLTKTGKYTLIGKLDESGFPNPKGLAVVQNIYVRNVDNLFYNPSFEEGTNGWSNGNYFLPGGTPAAIGKNALQVRSGKSLTDSYNLMFPNATYQTELAEQVAAIGNGQYYLSAQVRDFLYADEVPHTDVLKSHLEVRYKQDPTATSATSLGKTEETTLSSDSYRKTSGVFELDNTMKWLRMDLRLTSLTKFNLQWILVDDMQFLPINILIPKDEEPADVVEVLTELPVRAVVQDYDKYVGENWKEALGLPKTVDVRTEKGVIGSVEVTWDYTPLNLKKTGKYTLVGTLDGGVYPNPNNLYVTQVIYIREAKNLFYNPSFESGVADWSWGSTQQANLSPAADGKFALGVRSSTNAYTSFNTLFPANTTGLAARVTEEGAGQYYFSMKVRDFLYEGETNHTEPLRASLEIRCKKEVGGSTTIKGETDEITLTQNYQESSGVFNLDGDDAWIRTDLNLKSSTKFKQQWVLVDDMQFIPLNVTVTVYEGAMEEVQTIIPDRKIIQNYPNYVEGFSNADLLFPENVMVRSDKGELVKVAVKWEYSMLDLTKLGTYTIPGVLDDMRLANPNGLTVSQTVTVVSYKNLLNNAGFDDGLSSWNKSSQVSTTVAATPKIEGDYSLEVTMGRLENYTSSMTKETYLQAIYSGNTDDVGQLITQTGAGRYYFSVWARASSNATDIALDARLLYKNVANGTTSTKASSARFDLSAAKFQQANGTMDIPGDVTWARMDIYFYGTCNEMRLSTLFLDNAELVPLNVEVPKMNDIIYVETPANIYVHEGSSIAGLKLPEKLEVLLKSSQRFGLEVEWDTSNFDPNKIGEQTIIGSLVLGNKYKNTQNFVPTVKVTVRAKGEELRQTIYLSTSGSEDNDGLTPETPKTNIKNIPTYLKEGYNVRLKRGDTWYMPTGGIALSGIYGTEDVPVVLGAYGSSGEQPTIAYLLKIENSAWKLVDEKRNVYAADVTALGSKNGEPVHRCFVDNVPYTHKARNNYVTLDPGWYCSYGGKLYIRMPEGEVPKNVEATPYAGSHRLSVKDSAHLTIEHINFTGGGGIHSMFYIEAPTKHLKFQYNSITKCFYYVMVIDSVDGQLNYKPEISHNFIDAMFNEDEGAKNYDTHWNVGITEGITMRHGVDGAWVHHNHIRNMSHAFIAIENSGGRDSYKITGVRNCYIEDNLLEGGNALYARAFNINGGFNLAGQQMCHSNTWRRNKCYDMTTSSHMFGEDNLIYSNLISYVHCEYDEEGKRFDGKSSQPYGFDIISYGDHGCVGNILVNNTFYNVSSAAAFYDLGGAVYNSIVANNLIINWTSDAGAVYSSAGAIFDTTVGQIYVMNNGLYADGRTDHFVVDGAYYSAEDANEQLVGYSGNIFADPKFVDADLTLTGKGARQDFTLSGESPMRYAGLSLYSSVYEGYSAWERLKAEYTDLNGVVYLAESPSIGAISYCERIKGEVASVSKLEDIVSRTGAKLSQLNLPDTVTAKNDQGIEVVLLIVWDEEQFDSTKPGTVTLTGQLLNGPHTELNVEGKTVSINIHIKDKLELISINSQVLPLTVFYNTSLEGVIAQLPQTLRVITETGFEEELPVTWVCEGYKPTVPDTYTFRCVFPSDLITNPDEYRIDVDVRVLHEIGRGMELLINPDFIEGTSTDPWKSGWGSGSFRVTQDPEYLYPGEPASVIVTDIGKYGSVQQNVTGQVKLMGDGKYLFRCYMRSYEPHVTIDSSYAVLQIVGKTTDNYRLRAKVNIGAEWVEYNQVLNVKRVDEAATIMFHTSTGKSKEDSGKSFVISGCSFIYLGTTDAEVEATLDSIDLTWNSIKADNGFDKGNVMSNLTLPSSIGTASKITWTSSDETAITNDGKVTMGRVPKTVTLTATITYKGIETVKKFTVTVPRNPDLPTFSGALTGSQSVNIGDEFKVVISLAGDKATTFNAYRFTLSFNTGKVEYVGISDPTSTVKVDGGKIEISGIGTERPVTDTITVTFRAKKSGITEVKLVKVEMDLDPNASLDNLPTMTVTEGTALIDVQKTDDKNDSATDSSNEDNSSVIWIVIGLVVAALIAGGAIAIILIKKKKQTPPATEE